MSAYVPAALRPGALIGAKYRVERIIARGGQGTVVEATHLALRQSVAIKFSHVDREPGARRPERLLREARAVGRLRGEHVARVLDIDSVDGMRFIVMEHLRGTDLKHLIAARGPLPHPEAVGLLLQACDGVAEAHDVGIVHRDLKPSNLFLVERPAGPPLLKVLDFGIAREVGPICASEADGDVTEPLVLLGTPGYMAPEQARDSHNIDARADVWSLGLILYELVTGQPAFRARTPADVLALVLLKNPTPVSLLRPEVPAGIERVILRCLQKQPEHRFATVRELAAELAPFGPASDKAVTASERSRSDTAGPPAVTLPAPPRRAGARAALWGAGAALLLAGLGLRARPSPPKPAVLSTAPATATAPLPEPRPVAEVPPPVARPLVAESARPGVAPRRSQSVKAPRLRARIERSAPVKSARRETRVDAPADLLDPLDGRK